MSLKDFLAKAEASAPKQMVRSEKEVDPNRVKQIWMSVPSNQGTIKFVPITSLTGEEIHYAYNVDQVQVHVEEPGEEFDWKWIRVLEANDYCTNLTAEQRDQINRIKSKVQMMEELGYENDWIGRGKNYALIFGYVLSHVNKSGEVLINKDNRQFALIVMPSKNVSKAMQLLGNNLLTTGENAEAFFNMIFNRETTRKAYLEVVFQQGSGFGYDVSIVNRVVDVFGGDLFLQNELSSSSILLEQEGVNNCTTQTACFLGNYGDATGNDFLQDRYNLLETQVDLKIKEGEEDQALPPVPVLPNANIPTGNMAPQVPPMPPLPTPPTV